MARLEINKISKYLSRTQKLIELTHHVNAQTIKDFRETKIHYVDKKHNEDVKGLRKKLEEVENYILETFF